MDEITYFLNVSRIIDDLLKNASHSFGLDFRIINETGIETNRRIQTLSEKECLSGCGCRPNEIGHEGPCKFQS